MTNTPSWHRRKRAGGAGYRATARAIVAVTDLRSADPSALHGADALVLYYLAWHEGRTDHQLITYTRLASNLGLHRTRVGTAIRRLHTLGIIDTHPTVRRANGHRGTDQRRLLLQRWQAPDEAQVCARLARNAAAIGQAFTVPLPDTVVPDARGALVARELLTDRDHDASLVDIAETAAVSVSTVKRHLAGFSAYRSCVGIGNPSVGARDRTPTQPASRSPAATAAWDRPTGSGDTSDRPDIECVACGRVWIAGRGAPPDRMCSTCR